MPWVRLDDQFHAHPKLAGLGPLTLPAVGLHLIALTWCGHYLTDGHVPSGQVRKFGGSEKLTDALVAARLWELAPDGFRLHDYLVYNPSREKVLAQRAAEAERKRLGRESASRPPGQRPDSGSNPPVPSLSRPSPVQSVLPDALTARVDAEEDDPEEGEALTYLARHGAHIGSAGNGLHRKLIELVGRHGMTKLIGTFDRIGRDRNLDARGYIFGASNVLDPIPTAREERVDEGAERSKREVEATQKYLAKIRGETA